MSGIASAPLQSTSCPCPARRRFDPRTRPCPQESAANYALASEFHLHIRSRTDTDAADPDEEVTDAAGADRGEREDATTDDGPDEGRDDIPAGGDVDKDEGDDEDDEEDKSDATVLAVSSGGRDILNLYTCEPLYMQGLPDCRPRLEVDKARHSHTGEETRSRPIYTRSDAGSTHPRRKRTKHWQ